MPQPPTHTELSMFYLWLLLTRQARTFPLLTTDHTAPCVADRCGICSNCDIFLLASSSDVGKWCFGLPLYEMLKLGKSVWFAWSWIYRSGWPSWPRSYLIQPTFQCVVFPVWLCYENVKKPKCWVSDAEPFLANLFSPHQSSSSVGEVIPQHHFFDIDLCILCTPFELHVYTQHFHWKGNNTRNIYEYIRVIS